MRSTCTFILFISLLTCHLSAQNFTSSHLPIVVLTTEDDHIPDEPKILATMGIIDNGTGLTNQLGDEFNAYDGNIGIETRGNSTQDFEKKTYSIELWDENEEDISAPLLGMGKEEDWVLHAMVIDKTQLRIPMSFYLSQRMGHYAANWRFVELVWNGEYRGIYILTEKIKRDNDRVDIAKLDDDDIAGDSLTGGYILRLDWLDEDEGFESEYDSQGGIPLTFQWYYPKSENIQPQQASYIENWINTFENALFSPDFSNAVDIRYNEYINLTSFCDFLLINEFSKNADGYKLSTYMHKQRDSDGGKLVAGPIWDFDQTYGMSLVCSNHNPQGWTYLQNQEECEDLESMPLWWQAMMSDTLFTNRLACRWTEFRESFLHQDSIFQWIDDHVDMLGPAIDRNFERWDFIGEHIWIEPEPIPQSYEEEIEYMKNWINNRLIWMDAHIPGNCGNDILSTENIPSNTLEITPNPARNEVFVKAQLGDFLKLHTLEGKLLYEVMVCFEPERIDLAGLAKGMYLVSVVGEETKVSELVVVY